jgi:gliding motility-associated lipoprotein GldD
MKVLKIINIIPFLCFCLLFGACGETSIPRPYGYFRVDLPTHNYRTIDTLGLPYRFDLPTNAKLISREANGEKFWIDLYYPTLNASIYCSYKPVKGDLIDLLEDTRRIVYKHSIKADGIGEKVFESGAKDVHGILYDLKGNTASSVQFILTDSTRNFFRGALYFNNVPNKDSIAPMSNYIREDIIRIMESFEWKK